MKKNKDVFVLLSFIAFCFLNLSQARAGVPDTLTEYGDLVRNSIGLKALDVSEPPAPPQAVGRHDRGKLINASRLPDKGAGYELHRVAPGTPEAQIDKLNVWGTALLVEFIKWFSLTLNKMYSDKPDLSVADLSMHNGGHFVDNGHLSHQNGLDVDIGFPTVQDENLTLFPNFIINGKANPLIDVERFWTGLKILAAQEQVVLIFVDSRVKQFMCRYARQKKEFSQDPNSPFFKALLKMQPWQGHNNHFHLRLQCPSTSPDCQKAIPLSDAKGTGCNA